jgi:NAD(P)-dependent dehydrogenase (short-subunit alcohol dehydrogenase family)
MKFLVVGSTGLIGSYVAKTLSKHGAVESFTLAAAIDLPRGLRINTVSPNVLVEATSYHPSFPGYHQVSAQSVTDAHVKSILGKQTGQIYKLD